jgi:hypothetical protein
MATEAIKGAKKINPKLLLDLFYEHIYRDLKIPILERNLEAINTYGRVKIQGQFNEIMPAIAIFDKNDAIKAFGVLAAGAIALVSLVNLLTSHAEGIVARLILTAGGAYAILAVAGLYILLTP